LVKSEFWLVKIAITWKYVEVSYWNMKQPWLQKTTHGWPWLPSGNLIVCYWKWTRDDLPIKDGDFPVLC
jgi:hypothetical protein